MTAIVVSETSSRAEIAAAILLVRQRAKHYGLEDPRRRALDEKADQFLDYWIKAGG